MIPGHSWVEVMFEVIVLVAHEVTGDGIGENGPRAKHWIFGVREECVLTHTTDVHEAIDENHREAPGVEDDRLRNWGEIDGDSKGANGQGFHDNPESITRSALTESKDRNHDYVNRIANEETEPIHNEDHPRP